MIRLLLDEGLPAPSAELLRQHGHDAVHTNEVGLGATNDETILESARGEQRTIVTLEADFHALMALSGQRHPSVIRIRVEGLRWRALAELEHRAVDVHREALESGALISVRERDLRFRRLPIAD